jgi:hypothetical protein
MGLQEKDSIQYNSQDLAQEQRVDIDPIQKNIQNLNIYINNDKINYSAKITGTTYTGENNEIAANVDILLFFGNIYKLPVYKTKSDSVGNYTIEDIPPGYYFLQASNGKKLKYQSSYIKVFPCRNVIHPIYLD